MREQSTEQKKIIQKNIEYCRKLEKLFSLLSGNICYIFKCLPDELNF